ncbi:Plant intracellular Ras-group-related LRR protein 4 [Sesamum angolense]|uniref:Plant intracellular Ras-group-related LRR protein 4 n=1 Tax=Sesamum angolense TaxID=2727404 RepID=A0AAE1WIQ3_9LAMI|nr:Plant intracellular Ras-group-related LRR protein 4 [Sesamum angolense]
MESSAMTTDDVVEEIMRLHRSLPARPGIDEVEAARTLIRNVEREDQLRLEGIAKQSKGKDVPEELFKILQEMQRSTIHFQSKEQKREALKLLDLESVHLVFDDLIQRASKCLPGYAGSPNSESINPSYSSSNSLSSTVTTSATTTSSSSSSFYNEKENVKASEALFTKDDTYVKKPKTAFHLDVLGVGTRSGDVFTVPQIVDPTLKQVTAQGVRNHLLVYVVDDCSVTRGYRGLSSLEKLDLHGNRITELPESIGDLLNLLHLDLRGNQLKSLPRTIARLVCLQELDLSSNGLSVLPETIGSLVSLKKLNVETNDLEEIPHTIGQCASLKELHADYNRLKALPEAVGRIGSLEILTVRYNNIRQLPTTMASLSSLRELDVSFNELESVPESLCFATTLVKLNISNNFADLQSLPRSIGNLEMLEELDMSNNQIRVLPDSFRMLNRLRVLKVEGNPLSVPPRNVIEQGPQAVVQYMADLVTQRAVKSQPVKQKKSWARIC